MSAMLIIRSAKSDDKLNKYNLIRILNIQIELINKFKIKFKEDTICFIISFFDEMKINFDKNDFVNLVNKYIEDEEVKEYVNKINIYKSSE